MVMILLFLLVFLGLAFLVWFRKSRLSTIRRRSPAKATDEARPRLTRPKPPWARHQALRLKALMPDHGCRKIAETFNATFRHRGLTVSKSWVAEVLKKEDNRLADIRRAIRRRKPRMMPRNRIWGLDLTFVSQHGQQRTILGMVDHGTRACLALRNLPSKATIEILRALLDVIECFGKPKAIRTDNEVVFTSKLFRGSCGFWGSATSGRRPMHPGRMEEASGFSAPSKSDCDSLRVFQRSCRRIWNFSGFGTTTSVFTTTWRGGRRVKPGMGKCRDRRNRRGTSASGTEC